MDEELIKKIKHFSDKIVYIERIGDIDYIKVDDTEYGLKDLTGSESFLSAVKESKILSKDQKYKEFRKFIPSYDSFKNLIIKNKGIAKIEGIFVVDMQNYISRPIETNIFYLQEIIVEPKYWNTGIDSIIYSYVERFVKELGYEAIYIGSMGYWQTIKFYKKEGFFPIKELDQEYIVPLLDELNINNIEITDHVGDIYIMPMHKYIGSSALLLKSRILVQPYVKYFRDEIAKSRDGIIRILVIDIAKAMKMTGYESSIYWGLKYALFLEGIVVLTGETINHEPMLVMRFRTEKDILPESFTNIER